MGDPISTWQEGCALPRDRDNIAKPFSCKHLNLEFESVARRDIGPLVTAELKKVEVRVMRRESKGRWKGISCRVFKRRRQNVKSSWGLLEGEDIGRRSVYLQKIW